ncbi:HlyU family transcriptional regulator [Celeribacter neptunius]|uniref:Transcriptional activator HlyU n=1 Tax=Celeribacter neptunius TaxID=588602 RepID=A0A1I3INY3_9RHOB|nr:HlyU family transcriptional regulator [Celeribacter neptunius]SFI49547.1 hypothetical protein SAMN04487991_0082 [Celeribacter neptunius]
MSLFSKLFGGKSADTSGSDAASKPTAEPVLYGDDFLIFPEPIKEASGYRVAARIEKEIDGEVKVHEMIRADTMASKEDAEQGSLMKAQMFIDQMGEAMFD